MALLRVDSMEILDVAATSKGLFLPHVNLLLLSLQIKGLWFFMVAIRWPLSPAGDIGCSHVARGLFLIIVEDRE